MSSSLESKFRAGVSSRSIASQRLFLPPLNSYVVEVRGWETGARLDPNPRRQRLHAPFFFFEEVVVQWESRLHIARHGRPIRAPAMERKNRRIPDLDAQPNGGVAARALRRFVAGAAS